MVHTIMKASGDIRSNRPLRTILAGFLLLAVTAAAANNPDAGDSEDPIRPPEPKDFKITGVNADECTADIEWTHQNPDDINITGFEYRTTRFNYSAQHGKNVTIHWKPWTKISGSSASTRSASVVAKGGPGLQIRATVAQEGADHSEPSHVAASADLDPDHPKCQ